MEFLAFVSNVAFFYPLFMSFLWTVGGLYFYWHWERKDPPVDQPPALDEYPFVTILVPCHNEADNAEETLSYALAQRYPHFEVIAINDGSTDATGEILDRLSEADPRLRVVHLATNQGKAAGLIAGAVVSNGEYLVCIDGDALLGRDTMPWMLRHFLDSPRVGAVTGNPRIRTRSTLLGRVQVGEFASIIGLIKRAQRVYGRVFTVSGVIVAFRKSALHQVNYWTTDMITEDIDISWKLQLDHWDVRYEPNALCWILMPESVRGLLRQRIRWAQGGAEVMLKYASALLSWRKRRMWPIFFELVSSFAWAYAILVVTVTAIIATIFPQSELAGSGTLVPGFTGTLLALACLLQFGISILIDRRYEPGILRAYGWIIWYPMVFWMIGALSSIIGLPKAIFRKRGQRAIWTSPDRGINPHVTPNH